MARGVDFGMNPYSVRADLDGDGETDYVTRMIPVNGQGSEPSESIWT